MLFVIACSGPAQQQPAPSPPPPQGEVVTEVAVIAVEPGGHGPPGAEALPPEQPAHVKLRLGHYRNDKRGIGVTIDLSEQTDNVADIDPAKLRFDGESTVYRLQGQYGTNGRVDYMYKRRVMLHVWDDGRRAVSVPGPGDAASEMLEVVRDADADPL